nr:transposase [Epibacterium ulvae]
MKILPAIVDGERDLDVLASHRDVRCKASIETIKASLNENDRPLEATLRALGSDNEYDPSQLPRPRTKTKQVSTPSFGVRAALFGVLGVDLTEIHGMGPSLSLKLVGECGTDLRAWPSAKHSTPWLYLAPGNKISGGKVLSSRTRRSSSRAAALLRLAAFTLGRSDTALGAFYRRLAARAGKAKAVAASARKIAVLFYNTLRYGMTYKDPGASHYEERYLNRVLGNLKRRAKAFGYGLQNV